MAAAHTFPNPQPSPEPPAPAYMQYEIWTTEEVAQYLRISPQTVTTYARKGTIPGFQCGALWRFRRDHILALL